MISPVLSPNGKINHLTRLNTSAVYRSLHSTWLRLRRPNSQGWTKHGAEADP